MSCCLYSIWSFLLYPSPIKSNKFNIFSSSLVILLNRFWNLINFYLLFYLFVFNTSFVWRQKEWILLARSVNEIRRIIGELKSKKLWWSAVSTTSVEVSTDKKKEIFSLEIQAAPTGPVKQRGVYRLDGWQSDNRGDRNYKLENNTQKIHFLLWMFYFFLFL